MSFYISNIGCADHDHRKETFKNHYKGGGVVCFETDIVVLCVRASVEA